MRAYGLERVIDIQQRAGVDLIDRYEEERIRHLWHMDTWPNKWTSDDIDASLPIDAMKLTEHGIATQSLLVR